MQTIRTIRRQLRHLRENCASEEQTRLTWIAALEWVLTDVSVEFFGKDQLSPFADLVTAAIGARHALRSYEHGNASPELAQETADGLDSAIRKALEARDLEISAGLEYISKTLDVLEEIKKSIGEIRPNP